jgi:hypothetical protein
MNQKILSVALLVAVCFGLSWSGCKRDEPKPIVPVSSPEARQQMLNPPMPPGHPPINPNGGEMPSLPPPAPIEGSALAWDLPKGWSEARPGGMRFATLKPPVTGKVDVSVIMLPGTGGGELGNVNRWRGQVGLAPIDEAARMQMRKEIKSKAGVVSLYDFVGEGADKQRMIAGLLLVDGRSWFLKMTGDPDPVGAARADFVKVLESLRISAEK